MNPASTPQIAYFSMEVGLDSKIPTYAGGLGVLAGDTLKAAADNKIPLVGITLLARQGHFFQKIEDDQQNEKPVMWQINDFLEPLPIKANVEIGQRQISVGCWKYEVKGLDGYKVPLLFLHTDLPENNEADRKITDSLYGGDNLYRLLQEIVLGIGGIRILNKLGFHSIKRYHLNEGHSAFLTLELLRLIPDEEKVRELCLFTTHTPVPAGHDKFELSLVKENLAEPLFKKIPAELIKEGQLNMTALALNLSNYVNGVAKKHAQISQSMFPQYSIQSITNGVHARTWTSKPFQKLYYRYFPDWEKDPSLLHYATRIPTAEVWRAHYEAKKRIINYANSRTNIGFDYDLFTIGWARRFTAYKRPEFLLHDINKLGQLAEKHGPLQLIFAGKAHPDDQTGKDLIESIIRASKSINSKVKLVYLDNYDMYLGKLMTSGVDIWLNTPLPPHEASGTSGMKCALNGIPHLSVLDGWWLEGHIEDETGWAFSTPEELYQKLDTTILPLFYNETEKWREIIRRVIAVNGSFFNASRMIKEYATCAYLI